MLWFKYDSCISDSLNLGGSIFDLIKEFLKKNPSCITREKKFKWINETETGQMKQKHDKVHIINA